MKAVYEQQFRGRRSGHRTVRVARIRETRRVERAVRRALIQRDGGARAGAN